MEFKDIAAVSGKSVLHRVVQPTRTGVILESLDEHKKKMVANMHAKVSILSEISVYTNTSNGAVPLSYVFYKIHKEFYGDTGLDKNSDPEELKSFMKFVLPEYDESRVYVSDIKKLVTWYTQLVKVAPEMFATKEEMEELEKKEEEEKKAADAAANPEVPAPSASEGEG